MENQKKSKHGLLISAIVLFIAGAAMLGGAVIAGAFDRGAWASANAKLRTAQGLYEEPKTVTLAGDEIGGFSSVSFDITSHGITLEEGTGEEFKLSYSEDFEGEFNVAATDGKLTVTQSGIKPDGKSIFRYFQTNMDWVLGFFDGWEDLYRVKLTVPAGFIFDNIDVKCTSGSVRLNGISALQAGIRATSGSVHLDNTEITGKLDLNLTSGSLHLNGVKAEEITARLTSGGARFTNVAAAEIETVLTSGSFRLTNVTADEMTADLTSGSLKVNSSDIKASYIKLSSGSATFADLPAGFTSAVTAFNVKVTSGSLRIDGSRKESSYVSSPQDAAYKIEGKLTSGSFRFN